MVFVLAASTAAAQPPLPVSEQAQIEQIRQRIEALEQRMLEELSALRNDLAAREAAAPGAQPAPAAPPLASVSGAAQGDTFSRDCESVARVNNAPTDAGPQGFLAIPGTPARVKVDGYAKLDTIVDTKPAGNPDQFVPSSIPIGLPDALRTATTTLHIRQTRVNLDFRSPTELGEFRSFAELDFYGAGGPLDARLRHFYGQIANVLIGQTWTTFTDVDAFPDTLDLSGPSGMSQLRQAQLRYTHPLAAGQSLALAIERPITQAPVGLGDGGASYSPAPDVVARYRFERPRGHLQIGSVFRSLGYRVSERNATTLGIGVNAVGTVRPTEGRDLLLGLVVYGHGVARYVDTLSGVSADLGVSDSGDDLTALPALGWYTAFTHHWSAAIPLNRGRWLQRHRQHRRSAGQRLQPLALRVGQSALESRRLAERRRRVSLRHARSRERRPRACEPCAVCRQVPTCSASARWGPSRGTRDWGLGIRD